MNENAILYSFRRCPYAIRARLAISYSGMCVELREVVLRDKPQALLDASSKASVPVLITREHEVIDESVDIMRWSLEQTGADDWYQNLSMDQRLTSEKLIEKNDAEFKYYLDRYKYADRYPEHPAAYYRQQAETFLVLLEQQLAKHGYLVCNRITFADMAILPFIRQFAATDKQWLEQSPYHLVKAWLHEFLESSLFNDIMQKYPAWKSQDKATLFP